MHETYRPSYKNDALRYYPFYSVLSYSQSIRTLYNKDGSKFMQGRWTELNNSALDPDHYSFFDHNQREEMIRPLVCFMRAMGYRFLFIDTRFILMIKAGKNVNANHFFNCNYLRLAGASAACNICRR